eukprot:3689432-Pyramimonas_sp.AAC.1
MGRIVGNKQMERLVALLQSHNGEVVCGGEFDLETRYIAPTVLRVSLNSCVMQVGTSSTALSFKDELFGPVLPVCEVPDVDAAVAIIRGRPKPLALYVFSASSRTQEKILKTTRCANTPVPQGRLLCFFCTLVKKRRNLSCPCRRVVCDSPHPERLGSPRDPAWLFVSCAD